MLSSIMANSEQATNFVRYFTLDEAVALLPDVKRLLDEARAEISEVRDNIILYKRILMSRKQTGQDPSEEEIDILRSKYDRFEEIFAHWVDKFYLKGILLRDLDTGLLDFPYHSKETNQDYFLCWRSEEEGIFYFHPTTEGFTGRRPISLLPE